MLFYGCDVYIKDSNLVLKAEQYTSKLIKQSRADMRPKNNANVL